MSLTKQISKTRLFTVIDDMESGLAARTDVVKPTEISPPGGAFYNKPVEHDDGQVTYVKNEVCFPYFNKYYGCSVCVKVCPFNHQPYEKIKAGF